MLYKYSEEYDNIQHGGADQTFIEDFFKANIEDPEKARIQLLAIYELEANANAQKVVTSSDKTLAVMLARRNNNLIEREYSKLKIQASSKRAEQMGDGSLEEAMLQAEMDMFVAEKSIEIYKDDIGLLTIASNAPNGMILGKEREISEYSRLLAKKKNPEVFLEIMGLLNYDLQTAQARYNTLCEIKKESGQEL